MLFHDEKFIECSHDSLEGLIKKFQEFVSSLPPDVTELHTSFCERSGYGDSEIGLEVRWKRPATPQEIKAQEAAEELAKKNKLLRYKALKKELGL